jgi:hypothetical protein
VFQLCGYGELTRFDLARGTYRDEFEAFKVAAPAQAPERLLYASGADAVRNVDYTRKLLERVEEQPRYVARLVDSKGRERIHNP